ncbi:DnaJ domain-containing protein [Halteromyces radiatus]|uniref:DnaJ domain-containing protein n=1 Tax=Halteromyces radiatus TaxID=101107 RepID=UPI002220100A|nr:DnaJ domain-containing protein [Halteromyces radiatus]KAI8098470.1 DnaJ domain-containing protein [Halteromyces radiatus]
MPSIQLPKGKSLYDILELEKSVVDKDDSVIKKAYRKLALQYHPDKQSPKAKAEDLEHATQQFQLIGYAYSILNDKSKRSHYDLTGSLDGEDSFLTGDKDWTDYFKELWQGVVSAETIEAHALKYKHSKEEEEDVLKYYTKFNGDMDKILAHVEHSMAADVPRFMDLIQQGIQDKKVEKYSLYEKTTTRSAQTRRIKQEQKEARNSEKEQQKKKKSDTKTDEPNVDDIQSLEAIIKNRQKDRRSQLDSMLDSIMENTTKKQQPKKKEPSTKTTTKKTTTKRKSNTKDDDNEVATPDNNDESVKKRKTVATKASTSTPSKKTNKNKTKSTK